MTDDRAEEVESRVRAARFLPRRRAGRDFIHSFIHRDEMQLDYYKF